MGRLLYNNCEYNFKVLKLCFPTSWSDSDFNSICLGMEIEFKNNKKIIWVKCGIINPNQTFEDCFEIVFLGNHWIIEIEHMMQSGSYEHFNWITTKDKIGEDIDVSNFSLLKEHMPSAVFWAIWGVLMEYGNENFIDIYYGQ